MKSQMVLIDSITIGYGDVYLAYIPEGGDEAVLCPITEAKLTANGATAELLDLVGDVWQTPRIQATVTFDASRGHLKVVAVDFRR